jgi:hypothetical protein
MRMPIGGPTYYVDPEVLPGQTPRVLSMIRYQLAADLRATRRALRSMRAAQHKIGMAVPVEWTQHSWYGGYIAALEQQLRDQRNAARILREYL